MKVWVMEFDHGISAHGVHGVARSLQEAFGRVRNGAANVNWGEPQQAFIGGAWLIRGTWKDGFRDGPQFVTYRITEHELPDGDLHE